MTTQPFERRCPTCGLGLGSDPAQRCPICNDPADAKREGAPRPCIACGYDTRGLPLHAPCPECGAKRPAPSKARRFVPSPPRDIAQPEHPLRRVIRQWFWLRWLFRACYWLVTLALIAVVLRAIYNTLVQATSSLP